MRQKSSSNCTSRCSGSPSTSSNPAAAGGGRGRALPPLTWGEHVPVAQATANTAARNKVGMLLAALATAQLCVQQRNAARRRRDSTAGTSRARSTI
jgi:hypothetical protein